MKDTTSTIETQYNDLQNLDISMFQCVKFPNLFSLRDEAREVVTRRPLLTLDASEESLYRAWAVILRAYSGEDGGVAFYCKHGIVNVESAESSLQYHVFDIPRDALSLGHSGVFVDTVSGDFDPWKLLLTTP